MIYSEQHDVAVYSGIDPMLVPTIPGAKLVGDNIIVPNNLPAMQRIRALGMDATPVMDRHYDWPIVAGMRPRAHQKVMANALALNKRCFNLSDMGTMKTMATLWAADFVMAHYPPGTCRAIIVAPLSTLQSVWADAIFWNFIGRRTAVVVHGSAATRVRLMQTKADFYLINVDGLGVGASIGPKGLQLDKLAKVVDDRHDIRMCIVDEASCYRDPSTRRHRVARRLVAPREYVWMMTGTPTPQGPEDAYGMAKLVNNAYGKTLTGWREETLTRVGPFKLVPKAGSDAKVAALLSPAVRYHIKDCVDLPECVVQTRDVEMSAEQNKHFKELAKHCFLELGKANITAVNEAVLRNKLVQIACGAIYDIDHKPHRIDARPRIAVLKEIISQSREKIIVLAPLTSVLDMLYDELTEVTRVVVNGSKSLKERSDAFRSFQFDDDPKVLLADPTSMAHGLTLTAAATIVWYAPTDKTEIYLQANKRIDRPGQTKVTNIVQLSSTKVEREIYSRLESNKALQGAMLKIIEEQRK